MPHDERTFLGPAYPAALRLLVDRALGEPRPVPRDASPGGPIHDRISRPADRDPGLVVSRGIEAENAEVEVVSPEEYWTKALAHRWLCIGPWADLADREELTEKLESRLLTAYRDQYQCTPLPHDLLGLVRLHHGRRPEDELPEWLETVRESLLSAPTAGEAMRCRAAHRAAAMLRCVEGACSETGTGIVELFADIFALSLAAKHDLERALERAGREGKSIAAIVKEMSDSGGTTVEMILPRLRHSGVRLEDFPSNRHEAVLALARRRQPVAWESFLDSAPGVTPAAQGETVPTARIARGPGRPHEPAADDAIADPVQAYRGGVRHSPISTSPVCYESVGKGRSSARRTGSKPRVADGAPARTPRLSQSRLPSSGWTRPTTDSETSSPMTRDARWRRTRPFVSAKQT